MTFSPTSSLKERVIMAELETEKGFILLRKMPTCVAALTAACLLAGCEATSAPAPVSADRLTYFEDYQRGLCFAALASQTHNGFKVVSITNVPCDAAASHSDAPISATQAGTDERSEGVNK